MRMAIKVFVILAVEQVGQLMAHFFIHSRNRVYGVN